MKNNVFFIFILFSILTFSQKNSLQLGDYYADDQLYLSISYSQFIDQPQNIENDNFSYSLSGGFIKDIILNENGTFAIAGGFGLGADYFNHDLKIEEINGETVFTNGSSTRDNKINIVNLELPLQLRWRTSTANKYKFWRIYGGITFLYNLSNTASFIEDNSVIEYKNISSFRKWQYGATLSAGFGKFNLSVFYGLTPLYDNATLNGENINTKTLKLGFMFFFL